MRDGYEALTGTDFLDGTQLSTADQVFAGAGLLAGPLGKIAKTALKGVDAASGVLRRPYIRKGTRAEVERRAPRTSDGRPIDPNTGRPIEGAPDLGHQPGHEFRRERARAESEGLSQKEFNDRMNDPDLYQLEDPSSNRSHKFEEKP